MMDDAGETSAVKSKIQLLKPSEQEIATHEACGHCPYRDGCRACVGGTGRSDARKCRHEEQNSLPVASMDYGFFADGDDQGIHSVSGGESQGEYYDLEHACPMQRCGGPGSNEGNGQTWPP